MRALDGSGAQVVTLVEQQKNATGCECYTMPALVSFNMFSLLFFV